MERTEIEKNLDCWSYGLQRGRSMVRFFEESVSPLERLDVLDVGCGYGGISLAFREKCRSVIGIDIDSKGLAVASRRVGERRLDNVVFREMDMVSLAMPDESVDLVIINGVLEYAGEGRDGEKPESVQSRVLREVRRVLRPGGMLYLAMENRWFPYNLFSDPHTYQPLVAVLPRSVANWLSLRLNGEPYQHYVYSYWQLKRLLARAGFHHLDFYIPIFEYLYPWSIVPIGDSQQLIQEANKLYAQPRDSDEFVRCAKGRYPKLKRFFWQIVATAGLQKLLSQTFVVVAKKQ